MDFIKLFMDGPWRKKASKYIKDNKLMNELLKKTPEFIQKSGLSKVKEEIILMYNYVKDIIQGNYKNYDSISLIEIVATLIYVVSPIDLIPDPIPFIGFVDDVSILIWALKEYRVELEKYKKWRNENLIK